MVKYVPKRLLGKSPPLVPLTACFIMCVLWMIALASSTKMWWVGVDSQEAEPETRIRYKQLMLEVIPGST